MDLNRLLTLKSLLFVSTITLLVIGTGHCAANNQDLLRVKVGGLFESGEDDLVDAFQQAIEWVNNDRTVKAKVELQARIERIKPHDSFHAAKLLCNNLVREGVWAVVGSRSSSVGWLLRSMANNLHIPHISVFWDYRSYRSSSGPRAPYESGATNFTINLYPEASMLSQAFMDLVLSRNWKSFSLIFEENEGLIRMKDLLRISSQSNTNKVKMSILQYDPHFQYDPVFQYKKILKELNRTRETNVVLSISNDKVLEFLREAKDMDLMREYNNYLIASLDIHLLNNSMTAMALAPTRANITGLTLLEPKGQDVGFSQAEWLSGRIVTAIKRVVPTADALLHDALLVLVNAIGDLKHRSSQSGPLQRSAISCDSREPWPYGKALIDSIKMTNIEGLSGRLAFDSNGQRTDFQLNVVELKKSGFEKQAKWTKGSRIQPLEGHNYTTVLKGIYEDMKERTLTVLIPSKTPMPYIFKRNNYSKYDPEDNDRYNGYCIDLLKEIARVFETDFKSKFNYKIVEWINDAYGKPQANGEWNGMIGQLLAYKYDMAIADLTATYAREKAVDFTMPFMNLGIAILYRKQTQPDPQLFAFLKPFSVEVWLYLASAYLSISLLLWILSRISPYEWVSGHPCDPEPEELENQFSIGNSLWFTIGSLMQQGSDLAPRALSTRTLASIWWFFTLIIISSYTANLAASLTLTRMSSPIQNVEDLAKQTTILYGCREGGSTCDFFMNSNQSTYQKMWNTMKMDRNVFYKDDDRAVERVKKGGYAYLMESSSIEYRKAADCDLTQIGLPLDNKGYGIACPPGSPYRTPISNAIVVLQDNGTLYQLKKRWWHDKFPTKCVDDSKVVAASELNIESVGGVFVVLVTGVGIGCLFALFEFVWKSMKLARHERESIPKLIWLEIMRIFTGGGSTRPAPNTTNNNTKSSIDSDSVRELESMAEMNNKLMVRLTPNNMHQISY